MCLAGRGSPGTCASCRGTCGIICLPVDPAVNTRPSRTCPSCCGCPCYGRGGRREAAPCSNMSVRLGRRPWEDSTCAQLGGLKSMFTEVALGPCPTSQARAGRRLTCIGPRRQSSPAGLSSTPTAATGCDVCWTSILVPVCLPCLASSASVQRDVGTISSPEYPPTLLPRPAKLAKTGVTSLGSLSAPRKPAGCWWASSCSTLNEEKKNKERKRARIPARTHWWCTVGMGLISRSYGQRRAQAYSALPGRSRAGKQHVILC